jgi:starch synthase
MTEARPLSLQPIDGAAPTVVHLCAEYFPYARTGGLAEAAWGLHRYQHRRGLATTVILPLYRAAREHIHRLEPVGEPYTLAFGVRRETFRLWRELDPASETPVCFIEHDESFDRPGIYGERGSDYPDNHRRFTAFAAAAVAALPRITTGPVVLHAHDWHTATAAAYLRTWWEHDPWFARIPIVLSVHNGGYQGHFQPEVLPDIGLPWRLFTFDKLEWYGQVNFLKAGLVFADMATTVSPTHAKELRTPAGGFGLQEVFQWMGDRFTGVLNGIDQQVWDPAADTFTAAPYTRDDLSGKRACKVDLQQRFGLPENPFVPVIGLTGRMVTQKGLDIVVHNHALFKSPGQFIFLGNGEPRFDEALARLRTAMPNRIGLEPRFSDPVEHVLMAGADLFLMPSQYEPCGLTQMRAQRYGTIPVARSVGGLADTIRDGATGFLFDGFDDPSLAEGMDRALALHRDAHRWLAMQRQAMAQDFGWDRVAESYLDIYTRAIAHRGARKP